MVHIVNRCTEINRTSTISNVYSIERDDIMEVVGRVRAFVNRVGEMEDDIQSEEMDD